MNLNAVVALPIVTVEIVCEHMFFSVFEAHDTLKGRADTGLSFIKQEKPSVTGC